MQLQTLGVGKVIAKASLTDEQLNWYLSNPPSGLYHLKYPTCACPHSSFQISELLGQNNLFYISLQEFIQSCGNKREKTTLILTGD